MNRRTFVKTLPALTVLASSGASLAQDSAKPVENLKPITLPESSTGRTKPDRFSSEAV